MNAPVPFLTDADVGDRVDAEFAVDACREAILAFHRGELVAPPRVHAELGDGRFAYTAGRLPGRWYGFRSYDTRPVSSGDQITAVHDDATGKLAGVAVGAFLGQMRTGAIGGVAADALAAPEARTMGLIGTGPQAWMQLWAICAVRKLTRVKVYSRDPERRGRFAANAAEGNGIDVVAVDSAESAVSDVDIAVLATNSRTPVVDTAAIAPHAFVTTMGPKQVGRAEFDVSLAERSELIATDSPQQLRAYDPPFVLRDTSHAERVVSLGAVLAGEVSRRPGALFCSTGLAGTEAYLLARLLGL
ncbi:MAG: ornithine cyclodeaminase family protein [Stackebrandtia sp.]